MNCCNKAFSGPVPSLFPDLHSHLKNTTTAQKPGRERVVMEIKGLNTDGFHVLCYKETGWSLGCQGRRYLGQRILAHEYKAGRGNTITITALRPHV